MEQNLNNLSYARVDEGYASQWELLSDLFALADYRLYLFYKYHRWLGPTNDMKNMLGLVVTREEFEHNLKKAAQNGLSQRIDAQEREQMRVGDLLVAERLLTTKASIPLLELLRRFDLDYFQRNCLVLVYAAELDGKYERLFAYLQDDITRKLPTVSLAVQLYLPEGGSVEEYISLFSRKSLFTSLFEPDNLLEGNLRLKPAVREFLSSGTVTPPAGMRVFDGAADTPGGPLVTGQAIANGLDAALLQEGKAAVTIEGSAGSGKRFQVQHLMARRKEACLFVDMAARKHDVGAVEDAAVIARLLGAYVCFYALETQNEENEPEPAAASFLHAVTHIAFYCDKIFLLHQMPLYALADTLVIDFKIESLNAHERLALFDHYLNGAALRADVSTEELATKFRFVPAQIRRAAQQAKGLAKVGSGEMIDSAAIHHCCYRQAMHRLDKLARKVPVTFTWESVVLPSRQKRLIQEACAHVRYAHRVFYDWGFEEKISYGKGLSLLFAGAPGTGKTMCAQVIAKELNMEMYKINISQIVSKYIGETEKNLQAVFTEAQHSNCILFFDECDAIFSKRSEVKDAHDRNANVEVAYLLQQIEEYDGVCILATNLMQNIDAAFMRRITFVLHFPFPDAAMRKEIYIRTLPKRAEIADDIDWGFLAERFPLSGGHIKNIVLNAAFMAAADTEAISMRHLLCAAVNELRKNDIVVVREELREYADLLIDD